MQSMKEAERLLEEIVPFFRTGCAMHSVPIGVGILIACDRALN
jgi:hypothetical protein